MDHSRRWRKIGELGQGGQGKVYRVLDTSKINTGEIRQAIISIIREVKNQDLQPTDWMKDLGPLKDAIANLIRMEDPACHGALKVLHEPKHARDPELAEARIRKEIEAMKKISHPNLLKILDADSDAKWFVSQFHPKGSLDNYPK